MNQNLWAKKFDEVAHIVIDNEYSVHCRKYGALLGNNYANDTMPICSKCELARNHYRKPVQDFRIGEKILLHDDIGYYISEVTQLAEGDLLQTTHGLAYFNIELNRFEFHPKS